MTDDIGLDDNIDNQGKRYISESHGSPRLFTKVILILYILINIHNYYNNYIYIHREAIHISIYNNTCIHILSMYVQQAADKKQSQIFI